MVLSHQGWGAVVAEFETKLPLNLGEIAKNLGLGKALNEGLKHCSHDWVFRMDTDDIWVPERFAKQVAFIEQSSGYDYFRWADC